MQRRQFLEMAAALGASLAWARSSARNSASSWQERREFFPQGVASGDPQPDSVLLWTRRPPVANTAAQKLTLDLATDATFRHVVATSSVALSDANDWTCRVLAAGLKPATTTGIASPTSTGTAVASDARSPRPQTNDARTVRFAFVSCQNVCQGAQNAYRRMIFEDERRGAAKQLAFVLHLGDFIYEVVWYPEDRPQGMYDRRLRDVVRFRNGEKVARLSCRRLRSMTTATLYRAYLQDPDLQDARARWPFVCVWDNHEFSWRAGRAS